MSGTTDFIVVLSFVPDVQLFNFISTILAHRDVFRQIIAQLMF